MARYLGKRRRLCSAVSCQLAGLWLNRLVRLGESLQSAIAQLQNSSVPSPRLNAELLLMFTIGRDRAFLYGHPEQDLSPEESERFQSALAQRSSGLPAQYITGHQEFWGMDLIVSPAVLIPRPETEHVIERLLEIDRVTLYNKIKKYGFKREAAVN